MSTTAGPKPRILVAEDEPELLEIISFFIESEFNAEVVIAEDGEKAKAILEKDSNFQIVVSDYNMPKLTGGGLLLYVRKAHPNIKFILVSAVNPKSVPEFKISSPDAIVEKPQCNDPLKDAIQKFLTTQEENIESEDYIRVAISQLARLGTVNYALYAKLSENKFLKVLHENEFFGTEELSRFHAKKINYLYIDRENGKSLFKILLDKYLQSFQNTNFTPVDLITTCDEISTAIHDMAAGFGFSEELETITKVGVDMALKTISSDPKLKALLENVNIQSGNYLAIHSSRLPYLANHIAKMMGWDSDSTAYKMALASLLHDSTLHNPIHAKYENETDLANASTELSQKDYEAFFSHTKRSAELVVQFKGIPPDVDVIISQHHERCDGTGFPNKLNHVRIAPLSCVFIVAHDLLCFYETAKDQFKIEEFIELRQNEYSAGYFKKILIELALFKLE